MTQEYTPDTDDAIDLIVAGMGRVTQLGIAPVGYPRTATDAVEAAKRWLAAHDAQIRAEALDFAKAKQIDNDKELLNEALSEAVKEYLLYGAHPLSTEEDPDDIWDDAELFNLKLTNGDVIDCSELADEVLDALKRYLKGQPVLQSIPVKEQQQ